KGTIFVVILLTILTIIAYHDVTDNFFSSDDFVWLKNAIITLKNPLNIFTTDIVGWFRPFGHLTFAINYLIFGVKYPVGYVVVSITFHIITAFFVFILTAMLLRNKGTALWAAAFFAIQHTHWEAVAWSSIVAEVLAALWFIVTIICFLKWRERSYPQHVQPRRNSGKWYYILAHVAMVCSFLSAELSVTLPAMLILTDMIYHWRLWKNFSIRAAFSHVWFFLLWAI
ncbi:MAG: hypothetical protein GY806_14675, partial [Gammaproteobacteria bacterium]|nr:hypothetical protein [Gammaproteobacteria bacterium]